MRPVPLKMSKRSANHEREADPRKLPDQQIGVGVLSPLMSLTISWAWPGEKSIDTPLLVRTVHTYLERVHVNMESLFKIAYDRHESNNVCLFRS